MQYYTLVSPCVHGYCSGDKEDLDCESPQRAQSFDGKWNYLGIKSNKLIINIPAPDLYHALQWYMCMLIRIYLHKSIQDD